jgi:hypothetical protein
MLKSLTPVATLAAALFLGLEKPSARLTAAVGLIAFGIMAASFGEGRFSAFGVTVMVTSVVAEAVRLNVAQLLMAGQRGLHPLEALRLIAPACAAWMALLCCARELPLIVPAGKLRVIAAHPLHFAASAVAGFGVNGAAFAVVGLSSALALKVLAVCKDLGLVVYGVLVLHEAVGAGQFCGYLVALVGVVFYNIIKAQQGGGGGSSDGGGGGSSKGVLPSLLPLSATAVVAGGGRPHKQARGGGGGGGGGGGLLTAAVDSWRQLWSSAGGRLGGWGARRRQRWTDGENDYKVRLPTITERESIEGTEGRLLSP